METIHLSGIVNNLICQNVKDFLKERETKTVIYVFTPYYNETYESISKDMPDYNKENHSILEKDNKRILFYSTDCELLCGVGGDLFIFVQPDKELKEGVINVLHEMSEAKILVIE